MAPKLSSEAESALILLLNKGYSKRKIPRELSKEGFSVSLSTVKRYAKRAKLRTAGYPSPVKRLGIQNQRSVRTPALIRKVDRLTSGPNPAPYSELIRQTGLSHGTVSRILKEDLKKSARKKRRTHALSDKQVQQRKDRAPRFLKRLERGKWKYIISLDESFISMNDVNGKRKIYYQTEGETTPENWRKWWKASHPKKIMFAAGICSRGKTGIYFVPPHCKVDRWFFIDYILKPIVEKDIPRLFPGEEHRVVLHFDSAPAHVAFDTYNWLVERGVNFIDKEDWMGNSPDMSPMDFGVNGILKQIMFRKKATTLPVLQRHLRKVWSEFSDSTCYKVMEAWVPRVKMLIDNQGLQIEHLK
jgi:hypothetical protein